MALIEEVRAPFLTRTRAEWLALLDRADLCLTPVNSPADAFADPHVRARGGMVDGLGMRSVRSPFKSDAQPLGAAPAVGEHTRTVLAALGFEG